VGIFHRPDIFHTLSRVPTPMAPGDLREVTLWSDKT
jgi:hypothetical protein